ncbi:MAG: alginate lyase family protein [Rubrivivax sp.]|nr:alginate lyase family protein [Rubrivivax sp.]
MQVGRFWRTIRWLKPAQVIGRARFKLHRPRPDLRPPPPALELPAAARAGAWAAPPRRERSLLSPTRLRFLGVEHDLEEVGWDDETLPLLWRYNQHYFDDLNAEGAEGRREWHRALVARWITENPPGRGTAWAPYPVSLRIVNWIKWFCAGQPPAGPWLASLAVQARWLTRTLEWHLLGNHLFINAKALVFAGLCFQGEEAGAWLTTGLRILERELPRQILADGAQFERSPMYHALALEDLLDLLNIVEALAPAASPVRRIGPDLRQRASAMLHWLRCLRHPGGALARFNDTAEGIAPPIDAIEAYAAGLGVTAPPPLGEGVQVLRPSGYVRAVRGPLVLLIDVAPIGPDYQPGHAHADTLSFELSLGDRELVVNRGTSVYGDGARRQLERSTAAHSTVQIGTHDSSEVWAGFRVGRRARPLDVAVDGWRVHGAHDGYAHLTGRPVHRREWLLDGEALLVRDRVAPTPGQPCIARYHLAPGLSCEPRGRAEWLVHRDGEALATAKVLHGSGALEPWQHARRFGELVPAQTLAVRLDDGAADVLWTPVPGPPLHAGSDA